jgi:ketosteroid isomerase-like protein
VTRIALAIVITAAAIANFQPASAIPPALAEMADAERAFAATAREKGIRDAFLEFFADDAMFAPGSGRAKDQLRKQPAQPFSVRELVWEPRTGDVARSGELGWLTGPGTLTNHAGPDKTPRYTNYLSIWRREPDGRWKVFIDVGTNLNAPATFAPGFVRFAFPRRYEGKTDKASAGESLLAADRAFNARLEAAGAATAFVEVLAPGARVHREGVGALTEAAAVKAWLVQHAAGMTATTTTAEAAASGDLGYSYGSYRTAAGSKPGAYLRVWTREAGGRWLVVADVLAG